MLEKSVKNLNIEPEEYDPKKAEFLKRQLSSIGVDKDTQKLILLTAQKNQIIDKDRERKSKGELDDAKNDQYIKLCIEALELKYLKIEKRILLKSNNIFV